MQPTQYTPSAPSWKHLSRYITSTLPVQGTRIILILVGYVSLIEPARSAAEYPQ